MSDEQEKQLAQLIVAVLENPGARISVLCKRS
jgi:hypothetical protein